MLPVGDFTPETYQLPLDTWREKLKKPLRRWLYPLLNQWSTARLAPQYATANFRPDLWLWGQRGNDYERQRRRVDRLLPHVRGRSVLVAGCGTGRDVESWLPFAPARVLGVDWFTYQRAWALWQDRFARIAPTVQTDFQQGDLANLSALAENSFDVIASDAVFEHLRDLPSVLREFHRLLKPGGVVYATFGPLWYSWGGDHVSGYDRVENGFHHLLLSDRDWKAYLEGLGDQSHSEHDGRTWIEHDLFSRLRPAEYLRHLEQAGFQRLFVGAIVDPRAVTVLEQFPAVSEPLLSLASPLDVVVSGMTILYRKPVV